MKPSSPLYYNAADVMAAFSRGMEPDGPPILSGSADAGPRGATRIVDTGARWLAALARHLQAGLVGIGPAAGLRGKSLRPAVAVVEMPASRGAEFACSPRPGLSSHYALAAPAE